MLFLTMIPPSCFLGVFATSFYIKGVIWRSFLQKKNSNWIYYQYNTMMTRNTSIFTYKIIQSAAYSLIWLCRKWFLLFLSNDNIHFWFEDWPLLSFYKITKSFFFHWSPACRYLLYVSNLMTSLSVILLQYHKRFFNDFQIYQILDILLQIFIHQWQKDCIQ